MKGFALDENGDVKIEKNEIQMVEGDELLRQTIETNIATQKGEWFLDEEQGIDRSNVLGKGVTEEVVESEIESAIQQVDDTLNISEFNYNVTGRKSKVNFKVVSEENDKEIEVTGEWE